MTSSSATTRPDYVGIDWLRCTKGMTFAASPPARLPAEVALKSSNLWESLVGVTLLAQAGNFGHADVLLDIFRSSPDSHLRDCAARVFALTASSATLGQVATLFEHPDYDARIEAYRAASLTCDLSLAESLARRRARASRGERDIVMDRISDLLEPVSEETEIIESSLDDMAFEQRVHEMVTAIRLRHGPQVFVDHGQPVDPRRIAITIAGLCQDEAPELQGGVIYNMFCLLEGLTGVPYAGCFDDDCDPVLPKISHTLNKLQQSGILDKFKPGCRYFFGHRIP